MILQSPSSIYIWRKLKFKNTCAPLFTAALFMRAKTWKQPKCPLADKWIKKMWYIYMVEYYSVKKRMKSLGATRMDLEIITLSEVSQRQISYYTTYIWNLRKRYKQTYLQNENNRTDRKQIYGYQRERVVGGRIN